MREHMPILLLGLLLVASSGAESWSWGKDVDEVDDVPPLENLRVGKSALAPLIAVPQLDQPLPLEKQKEKKGGSSEGAETREGRRVELTKEFQGRFLGIKNKLCQVGLGFNCKNENPVPTSSHFQVLPAEGHHVEDSSYSSYAPSGVKPNNLLSFSPPKPALRPQTFTPSKPLHSAAVHVKPSTVQHVHTHTHIHKGVQPVAPVPGVLTGIQTPSGGDHGSPIGETSVGGALIASTAHNSAGGVHASPVGQTPSVDLHNTNGGLQVTPDVQVPFGGLIPPAQNPFGGAHASPAGQTPVGGALVTTTVQSHGNIHSSPIGSTPVGGIHSPSAGHTQVGVHSGHATLPSQGHLQHHFDHPAYREDCECVPQSYCRVENIIARSPNFDIRSIINARSRVSDILSNATDVEEDSAVTLHPVVEDEEDKEALDLDATADEPVTTDEPNLDEESSPSSAPQGGKVTRRRRDLLHQHDHHDSHGSADTQERQFGGYRPGPNGCGANLVCCRQPNYPTPAPRPTYTCGRRNTGSIQGRIKTPHFERDETQFGEYPWQVAILKKKNHDVVYLCGGVLISDRHVLTAAHCIEDVHILDLKVRLGEWDVNQETEFYEHVESSVSGLYPHPKFYSGNLANDIAILTLNNLGDISEYPHISPVCLPDNHADFTGQRCRVTGWGKDALEKGGNFQAILKEVEVPVVGHYQCQEALRGTRLGPRFNLAKGSICAGGEEDRDACKGDGGSPLVCQGSDGAFQLAGLVSWGVGCGEYGVPGVYVDVANYVDWIHTVIY